MVFSFFVDTASLTNAPRLVQVCDWSIVSFLTVYWIIDLSILCPVSLTWSRPITQSHELVITLCDKQVGMAEHQHN